MNKIKYDAAYISYVESGESAAVFVARDIVWSIDTTGMWIDIIKLDGHKNNSGRWDFKYFSFELFPRKKHPKYPTGISDEDKKYIFDQLKANFEGECSEVGMYLCMARIAHREGYPEIGLYWEKAAYEEAEHAAKFAEMLGEDLEPNMKATTKDNLAWRVDCEFGATAGKVELATCAKKNNLDAIHDTVHEMARDEARHGKALKGLLDRYFGK